MPSPVIPEHRNEADHGVRRVIKRVREHLGMDVAYLTEVHGGQQTYRVLDGDAGVLLVDGDHSIGAGLCLSMLEGNVANAIPDLSRTKLVNGDSTSSGAYIGVPVRLTDGTLYGSLCVVSRDPMPDLDERSVGVVQLFADFLAEPLEGWRARTVARDQLTALLDEGAIVPAMQPIVSLIDGSCVGAEALARFPASGLPPDVMFARAGEADLDSQLELAAAEAALAKRHLLPPGVEMSFNIGPAGILSDGFAEWLRGHGPLNNLLLEITEHVAVEEYTSLSAVLKPLRADGLRLAVDDVGAGYASLRHVLQMEPDVIKIDRSLVEGIAGDAAQRTIVTGIILLALDLGAETIAEGVSTALDAAALTDLGIDMVQGYLLSHPTTDPAEWARWETPWLLPGRPPLLAPRRRTRASG